MASVTDQTKAPDQESPRQTHPAVRGEENGSGVKTAIKWIIFLAIAGGIGYFGWSKYQELQRVESTDDAQIDGTMVPISARVGGQVVRVNAEDEKTVEAGQVLVELDRKDYEVAVAKARADLADAEASLQSAKQDVPILAQSAGSILDSAQSARKDMDAQLESAQQALGAVRARLNTAEANLKVAQANANRSNQDLARSKVLVDKDEISKQDYDAAVANAAAAQANVEAQQAMVAEARVNITTAEKTVEQNRAKVSQAQASVKGAEVGPAQVRSLEAKVDAAAARVGEKRAELEQAQLNLTYTTISAPRSGLVGRKAVEVGQNIAPGQQLLAIVDRDDLWVTANFKESQLKELKIGQRVDIEVDANGRTYHGHVERIAGASGARFSLLPPENATGNFVKVVQRIPVRIAIDPGQNADQALRQGMSVAPTVHVH